MIEIKNDALTIRMTYGAKWEQWFLMMSDEHYDSRHCDRKLLKRHHDEALERNAYIMKFGDMFDCMGGKWDKRSNKADLRPEYQTSKYFDTIVEDAASFYRPYAERILLISDGNHETSIEARHEINLLDRLTERLNASGGKIHRGKYSGFIKFMFQSAAKGGRSSKTMYYNHGSGGSSPVTRGAIKTNRRQHDIEADMYVSGHIHSSMEIPRPRVKLNDDCNVELYEPEHILLGTYKNDFMTGGWADSKEFAPPNLGGYWLRFYFQNHKVHYEIIRAKQ
jgi:hypothetical protein